jgi:hypothetical protein
MISNSFNIFNDLMVTNFSVFQDFCIVLYLITQRVLIVKTSAWVRWKGILLRKTTTISGFVVAFLNKIPFQCTQALVFTIRTR